jgi:ribosomal protein L7/L12
MSRHDEFEALAEKLLLVTLRKGEGYTPPENAHMIVDTALAVAEDFLTKLRLRREEKDKLEPLTSAERQLIRESNKIGAIKSVRERTGTSLKEAKAFVDANA